jgi:hypothetical protein
MERGRVCVKPGQTAALRWMALIAIVRAELSACFRGEIGNDSSLKMRHP